jgi:hypothetical protein
LRYNRIEEKSVKIIPRFFRNLHSAEDIYKYNIYVIAETYLHKKNGLFTLKELSDIFRDELGQKSLQSSSNVNKKRKNLYKILINSPMFFEHIKGETFKIISNRKILNNLGSSKFKSRYYYLPILKKKNPKDFVLNRRVFLDYCIGAYLLCNKGFSNEQVAKHFNVTVYRVQKATKANNERENQKERIVKKLRFVKEPVGTLEDAIELRKKLWDIRICSTIFKEKNVFWVKVYRTNFYDDCNLQSHKFGVRSSAEQNEVMQDGKFKKYVFESKESSILMSTLGKNYKFPNQKKDDLPEYFSFNDRPTNRQKRNDFIGWTLDNYIQEYGILNV